MSENPSERAGDFPYPSDGATNVLLSTARTCAEESAACVEIMDGKVRGEVNVLGATYKQSPHKWLAKVRSAVGAHVSSSRVIHVDDHANIPNSNEEFPDERVVRLQEPRDLTGLGIEIGQFLQKVEQTLGATDTSMCFDSVTSLLRFVDTGKAFRFLHLVTERASSVDARAHYHVDPSALDERALATIRTLFDSVVTG